ncbi:MAG: protein kinase [Acidobacteria bacterium]|nr:protein kinase [Acidobacteriota bacterium]
MTLTAGTRIGPYEILGSLGAGGMGEVYRARDRRLARDVALKFLSREAARDEAAIERFFREARAASSLNHPNIVTIYEIGDAPPDRYVVMELVEGRTLRDLISERLSIDLILRICVQIARALSVAHAAGIVHRDIKPENIIVRPDGYVKLLDFGLACVVPESLAAENAATVVGTMAGTLLGTVRYMSPEQGQAEPVRSGTDVFSLGIVMYELATGQHPFLAESNFGVLSAIISQPPLPPSRLNPEIPAPLETLILQMLQKDTRLRPTAAEVAATLVELAEPRVRVDAVQSLARARQTVVGRANERDDLAAAFKTAAGGRGRLLCVSGEPGIGKTTLVDAFLEELQEDGAYVGRGRCSERLSGTNAYLPLLEVLDSLIHRPSGDHLARTMKLLAPSWYAQVAPVAASGSGSRAAAETGSVSPERLKRELVQFLEEVSRARPLVIALDDVHWIDLSSTDILAYLGGRFDEMRVLIIVSYRPAELLGSEHPFALLKLDLEARGACREITLGGLEREAIERYLAITFPNHRFPPEFIDLIHAKTEGSPLFASELLRYLRSKNIILEEQGAWRLGDSLPDITRELPESVRSMIQRQVDRLDAVERRLLLGAAMQGHDFHASIVARAVGMDAADVEDRLERLDRVHGLVKRVREEELPDRTLTLRYRFAHVLYQNALYGSLTPARKASLAGAVAQAILAAYGDQSPASELALLFEAARDFPKAADYCMRAARHAARVAAYQESVLLARRGLRLLQSLPETPERDQQELALLITLGVPLTATRSYASPEVGEAYARARELAQRTASPQVFPVLHGLYRFYFTRAELNTALEVSQELLERAERTADPGMLLEAHRAMGNTLFYRGEGIRARAHLETAMTLYDPTRDRSHAALYGIDPAVASRTVTALALWNEGFPDRARALMQDAARRARDLNHPFTLAWTLAYTGLLAQQCGDAPTARTVAEQVQQIAIEHAFPFWLAVSAILQAWAAFDEGGDRVAALRDMRQGLDDWFATGAKITAPYYLTLIAEAAAAMGQFDEARDAIDRAVASAERDVELWWQAEHYRVYADVLAKECASRGEPVHPEAEAWLQKALDVARRQAARSLELRALMTLARIRTSEGGVDDSRRLLSETCAWFTEGADTRDLKTARELLDEGGGASR